MRRFAEQLIALIMEQADDDVSVESHGGDHDPEQTKAASFNVWGASNWPRCLSNAHHPGFLRT